MPVMQNSHKLFLQSFMSHGIYAGKDVRALYKQSCQRFNEAYNEEQLAHFVNVINVNIKPLHLEIKKTINEETGSHCYGLVNTSESPIALLATDFSVNELELFKKLVETIVEEESGTVSSIVALNLADTLDSKMTKHDASSCFKRMERDRWLTKSSTGHYALSPRAILELDQYIQKQYPDLATQCDLCNKLVLQGQLCDTCGIKLHSHCAQRLFKGVTQPKCPKTNCGADWPAHLLQSARQRGAPSSQEPGPSQSQRQRGEGTPALTERRKRKARS